MQHGSDLIGLVEQAAVIACPAGGHLIGADLLAVEINVIQPQRCGAGIRRPQPRLYGERPAHHCTGGRFPAGFGEFRAHKLGFPLGCRVQQGGDEHRRFAPQGLLGASSGIGPNLHTGVIFLQRLQRQARRVHRGGVSGYTGFIVQQRGKIRGQGNLQAVLRLADVPAVPFQLPAEHGGMVQPNGGPLMVKPEAGHSQHGSLPLLRHILGKQRQLGVQIIQNQTAVDPLIHPDGPIAADGGISLVRRYIGRGHPVKLEAVFIQQ